MRGAALPAALLCVAFALSLGFAPRRAIASALLALLVGGVAGAAIRWPGPWHEGAFLFCWASVVAIALGVHVPVVLSERLRAGLAIAFGFLAGLGSAMVVAFEGRSTDLALALLLALLFLPVRVMVGRGWGIALKVVASWLVAVALLVVLLPLAHTPGYVPDHMR